MSPRPAAAADATCEPDKLATKYPSLVGKTIKVGTDPETPPYTMRDPKDFNHLIGLDTELAEATFKCIGVPIEFKVGAWSGQLPAVANGQTDVMWDTLYYTPERAQQMDFVIYFRAATGGLVAKGNPKKITGLDNVCGIRAAAALGSVEEKQFHDFSDKCVADGKPPIEVVVAADIPAGFRAVMNDRADLVPDQSRAGRPDGRRQSRQARARLHDPHRLQGRRRPQQAEHGARQGDHGRPCRDPGRAAPRRRSTTSTISTTSWRSPSSS